MTKDELLEALLVERHQRPPPAPREPVEPIGPVSDEVLDDSELSTARRRRELVDAIEGYEDHRGRTDADVG